MAPAPEGWNGHRISTSGPGPSRAIFRRRGVVRILLLRRCDDDQETGEERPMVNPEALAEVAASEPLALAEATEESPATPARPVMDPAEAARLASSLRALQMLEALPSTSRHRLELLV
jgi:hypothetical protein